MGGYGSTRWNDHYKKTTVEECLCLSVFELNHANLLQADSHKLGSWRWTNKFTKDEVASIGYEINTQGRIPCRPTHAPRFFRQVCCRGYHEQGRIPVR